MELENRKRGESQEKHTQCREETIATVKIAHLNKRKISRNGKIKKKTWKNYENIYRTNKKSRRKKKKHNN